MAIHRRQLLVGLARGAAGAAVAACLRPAVSGATVYTDVAAPATIRYAVLRDGAEIGSRTLEYRPSGDRLIVRTLFDIDFRFLGLTVYRYGQISEEEWQGARLERLTTDTNDDGERHRLVLHRDGNALRGTYDDLPVVQTGSLWPASFWNEAVTAHTRLIDPMAGGLLEVTVRKQGVQHIDVGGHSVAARYFRMRGDLERDVWYGPDGQLVQIVFAGRDGSPITIRRRSLSS